MLHEVLANYLNEVETALRTLTDCHTEKYEEEILSPERINLRVRIRFSKGYLLELNEAAIIDTQKLRFLSYRFHFQDKNNKLIFRYDNVPHFPDIETFPEHKHLQNEVVAATKPTIAEVITEMIDFL